MIVDMTFCGSPNYINACGRQMRPDQKGFLDKYRTKPIAFVYFCGEPEEVFFNDDYTLERENNND
jgi:hypothetical protein